MISLLINLLILAVILWVIWWALSQIPLPPPFHIVVRVIFALIAVIVLLDILAGFGGSPYWHPFWR